MTHEINDKSREQAYGDLADLPLADMAEFEAAHSRDAAPKWDEAVRLGSIASDEVEKPASRLSKEEARKLIARRDAQGTRLLEDLKDQDTRPSPYYRG